MPNLTMRSQSLRSQPLHPLLRSQPLHSPLLRSQPLHSQLQRSQQLQRPQPQRSQPQRSQPQRSQLQRPQPLRSQLQRSQCLQLLRSQLQRSQLLLIAALAACACAPASRPQFPAKPPGCVLEPVERLPRRPYFELETFSLPGPESMREVLDLVNERACRDGADAVYAPKGGRTYSYAIALKWQDAPPTSPPPASPVPASPPASPVPASPAPAP